MHVISLGYVKVATPGTPVPLGPVLAALNLAPEITNNGKVHKILFSPLLANSGITYVGRSATARDSAGVVMNKTTGVGVHKQIQIPATSGHNDYFVADSCMEENAVLVADFAVDADTATNGLVVSLIVL